MWSWCPPPPSRRVRRGACRHVSDCLNPPQMVRIRRRTDVARVGTDRSRVRREPECRQTSKTPYEAGSLAAAAVDVGFGHKRRSPVAIEKPSSPGGWTAGKCHFGLTLLAVPSRLECGFCASRRRCGQRSCAPHTCLLRPDCDVTKVLANAEPTHALFAPGVVNPWLLHFKTGPPRNGAFEPSRHGPCPGLGPRWLCRIGSRPRRLIG